MGENGWRSRPVPSGVERQAIPLYLFGDAEVVVREHERATKLVVSGVGAGLAGCCPGLRA